MSETPGTHSPKGQPARRRGAGAPPIRLPHPVSYRPAKGGANVLHAKER